jgi:Na+/melibiose symporter-like transporter
MGMRVNVAGRVQRRWERRGSWVIAALIGVAVIVAALWLLLPLTLS